MTSISDRMIGGMAGVVVAAPFGALCGSLTGYIYAKLANLPANQAAKIWAICGAAYGALLVFSQALIKDREIRAYAALIISAGTTLVGINELQKRNLIGNKMTILLILTNIFFFLTTTSKIIEDRENEYRKSLY